MSEVRKDALRYLPRYRRPPAYRDRADRADLLTYDPRKLLAPYLHRPLTWLLPAIRGNVASARLAQKSISGDISSAGDSSCRKHIYRSP